MFKSLLVLLLALIVAVSAKQHDGDDKQKRRLQTATPVVLVPVGVPIGVPVAVPMVAPVVVPVAGGSSSKGVKAPGVKGPKSAKAPKAAKRTFVAEARGARLYMDGTRK